MIEWSEAYATGIPSIDDQHKRLFGYFGELGAAIDTHDRQRAKKVIDGLVAYTVEHFAHEEALMLSCGFLGLADHAKAHGALSHQMLQFANRTDERRDRELLEFVSGWLVHHLGNLDRQYADHLARMGAE